MPGLGVELGVPLHVEPACAERVGHRGDERATLAPTSLAAQANAVDIIRPVGHRCRGLADEGPGRCGRHFQTCCFHQIGAIHDHRAFAVERCRIERAVMAQTAAHGGQNVIDVILCRQTVQRDQPAVGTPDRRLVHADGHDVELATLRRDIGGNMLTQNVFFKRDPLDIDAGLRGELIRVTLHPDHVAVVHSRNRDCRRVALGKRAGGRNQRQCCC